ncbi:MAG TPA: hypothetical protein VIJ51_14970 [Solirubrobacteraceae bacterium]
MPGRLPLIVGLLGSVLLAGAGAVAPGAGASAVSTRRATPPACSRAEPASIPANAWAPARSSLAPAGADAIRLCRYTGLNVRPRLGLARSSLHTTASFVSRIVGELDRLPPPPSGPISCPADDDSEVVVVLAYPGGHTVAVSVGLEGCQLVTNGDLHATAFGFGSPRQFGPRLLAELARLTGYHGPTP